MFNSMSAEVRRCLVVASELGGEAAQYVRVLRNEKERLLPVDVSQEEVDALMSDRDNADVLLARDAALVDVKKQLDVATSNLTILQVTNDEYKKQLTRQSEELELMQTNRVHAEVYQNVAAERDRALDELRTQEQAFQKELNKRHANLCACQLALVHEQQARTALSGDLTQSHTALVREQACRAELAKELQGVIKDEREGLRKVRAELEQSKYLCNSLRKSLASTQAEWSQERSEVRAERERERKELTDLRLVLTQRDSLMEAIRSLRKDPSAVSLELKKAEDKLSRVAAALGAPVRSSTYIDYPGVDIIIAAVRAPIREAMKDE